MIKILTGFDLETYKNVKPIVHIDSSYTCSSL